MYACAVFKNLIQQLFVVYLATAAALSFSREREKVLFSFFGRSVLS